MQQCVGIDDAHERHVRKIESLGNHRCAAQDADVPLAELRQHGVVTARFAHRVAVHPGARNVGELRPNFLFEFLGSRADVTQSVVAARRAQSRHFLFYPATVTDGLALILVPGHRDVAVAAFGARPARRTPDRRAEAPQIQEQNDLPAVFQRQPHRAAECPTDRTALADVRIVANIDDNHRRQRQLADPLEQTNQPVLLRLHAMPAFQHRRGAAENQRHTFEPGTLAGDVAGVVAGNGLLLERCFVLFVDDDQPEMRTGGEDCTPRPDDDLHLAGGDLCPVPVPLAVRQMAVQNRDAVEAGAKPADRLGREADFRHEHDRLPTIRNDLANRLDVDFGLAAAGHAVQQNRLVPACPQGGVDFVERVFLLFIEHEIALGDDRFGFVARRFFPQTNRLDVSFLPQAVDRARSAVSGCGDLFATHRIGGREKHFHDGSLLLRQRKCFQRLFAVLSRAEKGQQTCASLLPNAGRNHAVQHLPPPTQVVVGDPAGQFEHLRRNERLAIEHVDDRFELAARRLGRPHGDDVARFGPITASKRHADPLSRPDQFPQFVGNQIRIGRRQWFVEHDLHGQPILLGGPFPGHRRLRSRFVAEQAGLCGHPVRLALRIAGGFFGTRHTHRPLSLGRHATENAGPRRHDCPSSTRHRNDSIVHYLSVRQAIGGEITPIVSQPTAGDKAVRCENRCLKGVEQTQKTAKPPAGATPAHGIPHQWIINRSGRRPAVRDDRQREGGKKISADLLDP